MVTIFGTTAPDLDRPAARRGLLAAAKRSWLAYMNWRIERAAIDQLFHMSDRELKDIGLIRADVAGAAKIVALSDRPPWRDKFGKAAGLPNPIRAISSSVAG